MKTFFLRPRNLYLFGLIIVLGVSFVAILHAINSPNKPNNFLIYTESTKLFWNHIVPYGDNWKKLMPRLDYFLYGPIFNILFTPFAYLPAYLGPFAWNIFNFTLWAIAIFTLPSKFTIEDKSKSFIYTFLLLACGLLSVQYNIAVGYMFLFSYSLLERNKGFWAVALMMISGFTKVYGIFQLLILLFYPKFWRNIIYAIFIAFFLLLAPIIAMPFSELFSYYHLWLNALIEHKDTRTWTTIFYLRPFNLLPYQMIVQISVIGLLVICVFANWRRWRDDVFKISSLAILMTFVILFSNSSENHTYVISMIGYQLWYWTMYKVGRLKRLDNILYWMIFVVVIVMPIDILCPVFIMRFFYDNLQLNLWLLLIMWLRIWYTFLITKKTA